MVCLMDLFLPIYSFITFHMRSYFFLTNELSKYFHQYLSVVLGNGRVAENFINV